ncbi:hypothetical protein [Brevundimonas sp. RM1]
MGAFEREAGMQAAIDAAGGVRPLARKLGVHASSISRMRRAPRDSLFAVARAAGVEPETVRPDLADWIEAERRRGWMERARARFAISSGLDGASARVSRKSGEAAVMDLLDLGLVVAAVRFAAGERGLTPAAVMTAPRGGAGGAPTPEQSARSLAMGLAVAVGRVSSETAAQILGVTRQAVDNAAERYLRARDGDDDAEDGRVIERGRLRKAKAADDSLWDAQRRFAAQLAGEGA